MLELTIMSKTVRRLYSQFIPENYKLKLTVDPEGMRFEGSVTVTGRRVGRPSQRIVLHQKGLSFGDVRITRHDKRGDVDMEVDRVNTHSGFEEVRLHTKAKLLPGGYTVRADFKGSITRQMNGMYPCFFEHEGESKKLIATQFESHHAREVFPCIDEPEAKATFDLQLCTPAAGTVIANTPVLQESRKGSLKTTTFETTPKMPTYLLAFVYGELGYKEAATKDGIQIRCYATAENVDHTSFALDFAVRCLEFYNDYFAINYPLQKCDLIALPDFASGAMENWGCITFREHAMLVDPDNTSLGAKQHVAMVVAHELAHQWFGNLVTMRWWTDLWLNEGFASWIEHMAVDHVFPDWQMWTQFVVDEQQPALKLDALEHTHPVEVAVNHPDEIRTIFDTISYSKGASVIHMLHQYLGAADFRDGLRHYLQRHAYGNTDTTDLWAALEEISGKPVKQFMHTWTATPGFPILTAIVKDKEMAISQERFLVNPAARKRTGHAKWPVPLLSNDSAVQATMTETKQVLPTTAGDIKLNHQQSGFYRVIYDEAHIQRLSSLIAAGDMEPLDRLGVLTDVIEAAKAGYTGTGAALAMLAAFAKEDNAAVWDIIAGGVSSVRAVMDDEELRDAMKPYIRRLVALQLKRLGWQPAPKEPHFDSLLRPTILSLASIGEEPHVVDEALGRFRAMKRPEDVPPDVRGVVYGTAVRHGGAAEYKKLLGFHDTSTSAEEQVTLASALTGFRQPELIQRALGMITTEKVRLQDVTYWVAYSFMNRHAKQLTWEWMTEHWQWLEENLGNDLSFTRFPIYAARAFSDRSFLQVFKTFFATRLSPAFERPYNQGIEMIEWQSAWKKRDFDALKHFFAAQ